MVDNKLITMIVMGVVSLIVGTIIAFVLVQNVADIEGDVAGTTLININESILADNGTATSLTQTPSTFTSATTKNNSWLSFDGVNNYILVNTRSMETITFWYKNSTASDWTFIANVSGTTYVNGVAGTPNQYPVFFNGSDYFIGKENATIFFNGSIDDFRGYRRKINSTNVLEIYNSGRDGSSAITNPDDTEGTCEYIDKSEGEWTTRGNCYGGYHFSSTPSLTGAEKINETDWIGQPFESVPGDADWEISESFYLQSISMYLFQTGSPSYNISLEIRNSTFGEILANSTNKVTDEGLVVIYPSGRLRYWYFDNFYINSSENYTLVVKGYSGYGGNNTDYLRIGRGSRGTFPYNISYSSDSGVTFIQTGNNRINFVLRGVVDLKETICNKLKFNEQTGLIIYDSSGCSDNGTILGATWMDDGVDVTLTSGTDYILSGKQFTISNINYAWSGINTSYSYEVDKATTISTSNLRGNFTAGVDNVSSKLPIIFSIGIMVILIGVLLLLIPFYKKFSNGGGI